MHLSCSGYDGGKGAYEGNEASQNYSFSAVLFVKLLCGQEMMFFEKQRIFTSKNFGADFVPKPVAYVVSQNSCGKSDK